jgi:hypothetical protein
MYPHGPARPRLKECGELIRDRSDGGDLISQPGFEPLRVGDGRFPKSKRRPDFGAVTFRGSFRQLQRKNHGQPNGKLTGDLLGGRSIDFGGDARKASMVAEERQQHAAHYSVGRLSQQN